MNFTQLWLGLRTAALLDPYKLIARACYEAGYQRGETVCLEAVAEEGL